VTKYELTKKGVV